MFSETIYPKLKNYSFKVSTEICEDEEFELQVINDKVCPVLKEDEMSVLGYTEDRIYFFNKEQFVNVFSKDFKMKPYSLSLSPLRPNDRKTIEEILIFKDEYYTMVAEKLMPCFIYVKKDEEPKAAILVHPIKRKIFIINNKNAKEKKMDILPLVDRDIKTLGINDLIDRVDKMMQDEWDKLHGNKDSPYIS